MSDIVPGGVVVAAAAALGSGSVASATVIHTQSDLSGVGTDVRFVALVNPELHRPETTLNMLDMPAGQNGQTMDLQEDPNDLHSYAAFGLDEGGGVFVTFADPTVALGQTFESVFPGFSESQLAAAVQSDGPLVATFAGELGNIAGVQSAFGESSSVVHFSSGAGYGTFIASLDPIPAPGAVVPLVWACGIVTARRRR